MPFWEHIQTLLWWVFHEDKCTFKCLLVVHELCCLDYFLSYQKKNHNCIHFYPPTPYQVILSLLFVDLLDPPSKTNKKQNKQRQQQRSLNLIQPGKKKIVVHHLKLKKKGVGREENKNKITPPFPQIYL